MIRCATVYSDHNGCAVVPDYKLIIIGLWNSTLLVAISGSGGGDLVEI